MNPGGDYGKKELSPALRNRFTEVWVTALEGSEDLKQIILNRMGCQKDQIEEESNESYLVSEKLFEFVRWFNIDRFGRSGNDNNEIGSMMIRHGLSSVRLTLRDIIAWIDFIL